MSIIKFSFLGIILPMNTDLFRIRMLELRKERNISQSEVAKYIDVSDSAICFWENGVNEPKASYILQLAQFFGVTTDYLLGLEDDVGGNFTKKSAPGITAEEQELLRNYRALSEPGKKLVKTTIKTFLDNSIDEGISQRSKN